MTGVETNPEPTNDNANSVKDKAKETGKQAKAKASQAADSARQSAEHARVQILVGTGNHHLFAQKTAKHGDDGGPLPAIEPGITDERHIRTQLLGVFLHEGHERGRARFLFALEKYREPAGFHARQASTKVMSWPLSSDAPRPRMTLPAGVSSTAGSKGGLVHSSSGSTGCTS